MRFTLKKAGMILGVMTAAALAIDNFRLRVICHELENVVNYAVGGIHLDGVGEIFDDENAFGMNDDYYTEDSGGV